MKSGCKQNPDVTSSWTKETFSWIFQKISNLGKFPFLGGSESQCLNTDPSTQHCLVTEDGKATNVNLTWEGGSVRCSCLLSHSSHLQKVLWYLKEAQKCHWVFLTQFHTGHCLDYIPRRPEVMMWLPQSSYCPVLKTLRVEPTGRFWYHYRWCLWCFRTLHNSWLKPILG